MNEQPTPSQIDPLKDMALGLDWLRDKVVPVQVHFSFLKDGAIAQALREIQAEWTPEEVSRRCVLVRRMGTEAEELFVDGRMVIRFYPPETKQEWFDDKLVVTTTQKFKRVQMVQM